MARNKYKVWCSSDKQLLIQGWARDGLSEEQIAKNMGVAYSTFRTWKDKHEEFAEILKKSKEVCDRIVENALFERCQTRTITVKKPIKLKQAVYDETGKYVGFDETITYADEEVVVPADVKAITFWLKNRKPNDWKDKVEEEIEIPEISVTWEKEEFTN